MAVATSNRIYSWDQENAPILNGQQNSGRDLLDSVLRTGFNVKNVTSMTRSNNIVTVNIPNNRFLKDEIIEISNATQTDYNGAWRILSADSSKFTFSIATTPISPATGAITCKYPGLGWNRVFTDGVSNVYQSNDPTSSKGYLKITDTAWNVIEARMIERMDDINTFNNSKLVYWQKSGSNSTASRQWHIIGDSKRFYFLVAPSLSYPTMHRGSFFGDVLSWRQGDAYNCAIQGATDLQYLDSNSYPAFGSNFGLMDGNTSNNFLMRAYHQLGLAVNFGKVSLPRGWTGYSGSQFPNPSDNGIHLFPVYIAESGSWRGMLPGIYTPLEAISTNMENKDRTVKFPENYPTTEFIGFRIACGSYYDYGYCFFDIYGPW